MHGARPVTEYVPPVHEAEQTLEPVDDAVFGVHAVQELDDVPVVDAYVFTAQTAQISWPLKSWYWPAAQSLQLAAPADDEYFPISHSTQSDIDNDPGVLRYFPVGQFRQAGCPERG